MLSGKGNLCCLAIRQMEQGISFLQIADCGEIEIYLMVEIGKSPSLTCHRFLSILTELDKV